MGVAWRRNGRKQEKWQKTFLIKLEKWRGDSQTWNQAKTGLDQKAQDRASTMFSTKKTLNLIVSLQMLKQLTLV